MTGAAIRGVLLATLATAAGASFAAEAEAGAAPSPTTGTAAPEVTRVQLGSLAGSATLGPESAPVTVVAFIDYQCPFCARAQGTLEELLAAYPADVRIVVKHSPLAFHKQAEPAAQSALVAHMLGAFPAMHRLLLARQKDLSREALGEIAAAAGLDREAFSSVLDSGDFAEDVRSDMELARRIGVASTPYFFVNGRPIRGAQPLSAFRAFVDQELAGTAGTARWIDALERPAGRERAPAGADERHGAARLAEQVAKAGSPEQVTDLLVRRIAFLEDEVTSLREEVRELRRNLGTVAAAQRPRQDPAARTEAERDRIVTVGEVPLGDDPSMGSADAKIGIVVFGDYACPYTRKFSRFVLPTLVERYVDSGQARYVFRDRPLDYNPRSREAAAAANCAGEQGAYWKMHDELFALEGGLMDVDFGALARKVGLDAGRFGECMADPERRKEIDADIHDAEMSRLGLRVVPTLLIGAVQGDHLVNAKRVSGVQTLRVLGAVLDSIIAEL